MSFFQIEERGSSVYKECSAGFVTFMTAMYILFVNPVILAETGMPFGGAFMATVAVTVVCTLCMAFVANVPFVMAPGMGMNAFVAYSMCLTHNFHWKEALAIVFVAGLMHFGLMLSGLRKTFVLAVPRSLKYGSSAALGMFIAYIGMKNAGFLTFFTAPGNYTTSAAGMVISNSSAVPALELQLSHKHLVALTGLFVTVFLSVREKCTGDNHAPLLMGILTAIFVGIPLSVTEPGNTGLRLTPEYLEQFRDLVNAFWGNPGLVSLVQDPQKLLPALIMLFTLLMTNLVDSVCGIVSMGRIDDAVVFTRPDREAFENSPTVASNLDRSLIVNSTGGIVAGLLGSSTAVAYIESVTGIMTGGRTGLAALVTAVLFFACLPFARYVSIIPAEAMAPALIFVGLLMLTVVRHIAWTKLEESAPAAMVILVTPLTLSVVHGVIAGYAVHICVYLAMGRGREVHPMLYIMTGALTLLLSLHSLLDH